VASLWLLLHLASVVMWLGPTTAGYLLIRRVEADRRRGRPLPREPELWVWRRFETLLRVEHVAFVVLVGTGLARLDAIGLTPLDVLSHGPRWLQAKIALTMLVLVPVEIHDVWLSHVALPRQLARLEAGEGEVAALLAPHARFLARGVWLFALLVPALLALATFRPQ
jgi:hypothetical protein